MPIYRVIEPKLGKLRYRQWQRQAMRALAMLLAIAVACAGGLFALDASSDPPPDRLLHAIWNTVNIVSTLGDFTTLTRAQRIFMILTMLLLIAGAGHAITSLTGILSSPEVLTYRENRRMARVLATLEGHIIVVGFATLGELVAEDLRAAGNTVVVVDRDPAAATTAADRKYIAVQGAAEEEDTLRAAAVEKARAIVVTTEDSSRKLTITLMARALNPGLYITTVGDDRQRGAWLTHAGASDVIVVDQLLADALVSRLQQGLQAPPVIPKDMQTS